jgi:hypothetical protein
MENQEQLPLIITPRSDWMARALSRLAGFTAVSDFRFVAWTILIVLVLTSLPYVFGYLSTPPGKQFMGIMLDVPDHVQYFSWMRDLATANLISNRMTPEFNQPIFFNLLWWILGRLGQVFDLGAIWMYQILRVAATIAFLWLVYLVCGWFLTDRTQRRTAFLIATFTSGFGWVLVALKYITRGDLLFPMDVFIAEGNTFLGILGYPHFIAAACYIFVFFLVGRGQAKKQIRYAFVAGLVAFFLGWQHAYDLVSVYAVLLAYAVLLTLRDRKLPVYILKSGSIIGILSCSSAIYSLWLTRFDPVWKAVLAQFANAGVFTPSPLHLLILLGPAFILAIFTVIRKNPFQLGHKTDRDLFLLGWFLVTFPLIYLPVDFQIHLLNGWQVPIAILAAQGLFELVVPLTERKIIPFLSRRSLAFRQGSVRTWVVAAFILLILPTNLYLFAWRFTDLSRHDYPYYLSNAELAGLHWLEQNAGPQDVVMASLTIGQYIPALTRSHAYLAHWAQTLDYFSKTAAVNTFYLGQASGAQRADFLKQANVDYVFAGPAENGAGGPFISEIPGLQAVFSSDDVVVYAVKRDGK